MHFLRPRRVAIACLGIIAIALIHITPAAGTGSVTSSSRRPGPSIENAAIFKGLTNSSLGSAVLTVSPDQTAMGVCCCAGTLEECGFSVALRQGASGLDIAWNGLMLPEAKDGDQIITTLRGIVGGVSGAAIGSLTLSIHVSTIDLVEDFSPVAALTESIEVRNNGVTVYKALHPNAQLVSIIFPPGVAASKGINGILIRESPTLQGSGGVCEKGPRDVQSQRFTTNQMFQIGSTIASGNEIRFSRSTGQPAQGFTDVEVRVVNASGQSGTLDVGNEHLSFPDMIRYQGLTQTALGTAKLDIAPDGGTLTVSNIGSSGQDGVSIDIGRAEGMRAVIDVTPAAISPGAYMESRSFSSGSGLPHQPAGTLRMERVIGGFVVTPNFMIPGVPTYTARARRGGALIYSESGLSGGVIHLGDTGNPAARGGIHVDCNWQRKVWTISWDFPICGILAINGHNTVSDAVEVTPDAVTPGIELDDLQMVASGMPQMVFHQEGIHLFDRPMSALGEAHLDFPASPLSLTVANIGSSGNDGVSIDLGRATSVNVLLGDRDPNFSNGSYLEARAFGFTGIAHDRPLGILKVSNGEGPLGPAANLTADLGSIGSTTVRVMVFSNHALVADIPGHAAQVGSSSLWPKKLGKLGGTTECFAACYPPGNLFLIDGATYMGDEIRMLAEGSTTHILYKERLTVTGSVAPGGTSPTAGFTITGVEGEFLPLLDVSPVESRELAFRLDRVWPNPSHGSAAMRFTLPFAGRLRVGVYDIGGRMVRELTNGVFEPGERLVTWNNSGDRRGAQPGMYFVRASLEGAGRTGTIERRIVILD